jgi:predicted MFS family arabinose efflux permease
LGRAVFLLSLAAFASAASLRATDPLLPLIAEEYGVTAGAASAAVTAFALSYGLLQVVCGPLGDRYGRYRTIAAAALVSAFGSAACAIAPSLDTLIAARLVSGATIGAFIPLALAWIGDTVAYEKRQPLLARFLVGQMAGVAFGTAAAGWLGEHFGWRSIFLALSACCCLSLRYCSSLSCKTRGCEARVAARSARASSACPACCGIAACKCFSRRGTPRASSSSARSRS